MIYNVNGKQFFLITATCGNEVRVFATPAVPEAINMVVAFMVAPGHERLGPTITAKDCRTTTSEDIQALIRAGDKKGAPPLLSNFIAELMFTDIQLTSEYSLGSYPLRRT